MPLSPVPIPLMVENRKNATQNYGGGDPLYHCAGPGNWKKWAMCVQGYKQWFPPLFQIQPDCSGDILRTGNWLLGEEKIGMWRQQEKQSCHRQEERSNLPPSPWLLLPEALVGIGRLTYYGCEGGCSIGRGPQFYQFRTFLLRNLFGNDQGWFLAKQAPYGHIVFSLSKNSSRPKDVYHFEWEIQAAVAKYGADVVKVVNMANYDLRKQARIAMNSAVYITNHGGVGATSIFVQQKTSVFVYWHGLQRMDENYYESLLFWTTWIGSKDRPLLNATMQLIDAEIERIAEEWPSIACYQGRM